MTYTGHHKPYMPDGTTLVDWLRTTVKEECRFYRVPVPDDDQIAVVASAMRMHSLITHAAQYDYSELGKPDEVTKFWRTESSIGRFFRDASQVTLDQRC